ncbi:MAG TPA: cyclic dehypoxanthinyl futalosine synthase [Candidatus Kryptonia bacterium]
MLKHIFEKVRDGERLSLQDGLELFDSNDLLVIGMMADSVRRKKHPKPVVTYIIDRNINYTNVCVTECTFCAFYAKVGDEKKSYTLSNEALGNKIQETIDLGGTRILLQGGLNPELRMDYYEDLFRFIKSNYRIWLHALSPEEIVFIARENGLKTREVIKRLIDAGLDSIPGGGAEILVDDVRDKIAPKKCTSDEWLGVMNEAHRLGLKTTATMMFGHVESYEDRLQHMIVVRELQDKTGGFTAFIPWTFQPRNTELAENHDNLREKSSAFDYLKTLAISRLMVDNVDSIQVSWVTQGLKVAQIGLQFGADDFGSLMIEENVVSAAGTKHFSGFNLNQIKRSIKAAGFEPEQRFI